MNIEIIVGEVVAGIVACIVMYNVNKLVLNNKLLAASQKLSGQISRFKQEFPEIAQNSPDYVSNSLGEIGLDGILDSIGIPAIFKPIAKGFIDNIAKNPEKLKPILDKLGVVLPNENAKGQESNLL
jgi:hypothetical protein